MSMTEMSAHFGHCNVRFSAVREAFLTNFVEFGEVGARVTIYKDDEAVVDLWGGYTNEARTKPWAEDTLVCTMSVSKGIVALAAHLLADRGHLDYEAPVAKYWPEFAAAGKEAITVRQLLSHQASLLYTEVAEPGDVLDFEKISSKLAASPPNWTPGTRPSYHSMTYGFLIGTLVARIDGRSIAQFVHEEITGPLQADYILGCSDEDLGRVASTIFNPDNEIMSGGLINKTTMKSFALLPPNPNFFNSSDFWQSTNPAGSGVSNANGIARVFAPLANGGSFNRLKLLSERTIVALSQEQWRAKDSMFGNDFRVAMGFLLNIDFNYFGREGNFGSAGAGGFTVFVDPRNNLTFAYTPVRQTSGAGLGIESRNLVDALYSCV